MLRGSNKLLSPAHQVTQGFFVLLFSATDTLETCVFEGDGWEEEEDEGKEARPGGEVAGAASVAFGFLLKQSYICALIAMMAWSITYVSWLTCVLLLWSCVLWMMRERRRYTLMSSPWLVAYGNLLVILQYVYSFQAVQEVPGLFPGKADPCRELASKVLQLPPPRPSRDFCCSRLWCPCSSCVC